MRFVSLFAGIGGMDLGLERAGMECVAQVEYDPWCQRVLEKHWPNVPRWSDIRDVNPKELPDHDLIAGGFPCQNLSSANNDTRHGLNGSKSGLWHEQARLIAGARAEWVVVENVHAGWKDWVPVVRRTLWDSGYATVPFRLRASDAGAPHRRARVFVVGHTNSDGKPALPLDVEASRMSTMADSLWNRGIPAPEHRRMANGIPHGLDRLRGLGNAVVPQVAELVGRAIINASPCTCCRNWGGCR